MQPRSKEKRSSGGKERERLTRFRLQRTDPGARAGERGRRTGGKRRRYLSIKAKVRSCKPAGRPLTGAAQFV